MSALVLAFLLLFISICLLIRSDTLRFNMKCNLQESLPEHSQIHLLSLSGPVGIFRLLSRAQRKNHLHIVALTDSSFQPSIAWINLWTLSFFFNETLEIWEHLVYNNWHQKVRDKIKEEQYKMVSNADESNWLNLVYSAENINDDSVVWKYVLFMRLYYDLLWFYTSM